MRRFALHAFFLVYTLTKPPGRRFFPLSNILSRPPLFPGFFYVSGYAFSKNSFSHVHSTACTVLTPLPPSLQPTYCQTLDQRKSSPTLWSCDLFSRGLPHLFHGRDCCQSAPSTLDAKLTMPFPPWASAPPIF